MSEFTPGPWKIHGRFETKVVTKKCEFVVSDCWMVVNIDETKANARLISSAPEMHEAIKAALCDDPDWRRLCVDALAKAEGRAT